MGGEGRVSYMRPCLSVCHTDLSHASNGLLIVDPAIVMKDATVPMVGIRTYTDIGNQEQVRKQLKRQNQARENSARCEYLSQLW